MCAKAGTCVPRVRPGEQGPPAGRAAKGTDGPCRGTERRQSLDGLGSRAGGRASLGGVPVKDGGGQPAVQPEEPQGERGGGDRTSGVGSEGSPSRLREGFRGQPKGRGGAPASEKRQAVGVRARGLRGERWGRDLTSEVSRESPGSRLALGRLGHERAGHSRASEVAGTSASQRPGGARAREPSAPQPAPPAARAPAPT